MNLLFSPQEVKVKGIDKWKNCIVGHFVDKKLSFLSVQSIACRIWEKFGIVDVLSNEKGFFFFQFGMEGACRQIVEAGPWHFGGRLMVLQVWHPNNEFEKEGLSKLPIWIQIHNIPLQYWTAEGLSYIASAVGKPLYANEMTEQASSISYAKVCVEIDASATLPHSVDLLIASGRFVTIDFKYPWRSIRCYTCKVFGHSDCSQRKASVPVGATDPIPLQASPKGKVWVVKSKGNIVHNSSVNSVASVLPPTATTKELPCSNTFDVLTLQDETVSALDISTTDLVTEVVELDSVSIDMDKGKPVIETDLGIVPSSSRPEDLTNAFDFLPHDLGVGMSDPDAVFDSDFCGEGYF